MFEMLVTNLHYKIEYLIHIRNLKQALNHAKPYNDMNTNFRQNAKNNFEEDWIINNADEECFFLEKLLKMWEHSNIKLVTRERRRIFS